MSALTGKRILVVEDEAVVAAMIEDMLVDLGAVVVGPATSIGRGLALAGQKPLDAAVLDVNVRGKRIDPVVDCLRQSSVPIVFASGYGDSDLVPRASEPVLEKPFRLEDLAQALLQAVTNPPRASAAGS